MALIKTKGTSLYIIDGNTVNEINNVTSIDGISSTVDEIETTNFKDVAHTYVSGLKAPGTANFNVQLDNSDELHRNLYKKYQNGQNFTFVVALSDGTASASVAENGSITLPDERTFVKFSGYISEFPVSVALNAIVSTTISVRMSDEPIFKMKSA